MAFLRKVIRPATSQGYTASGMVNWQWDETGLVWGVTTVPDVKWDYAGEGGGGKGDFRPSIRNAQAWTRVSIQDPE